MKTNEQINKEFDSIFSTEACWARNEVKSFIHSLRLSDRNTLIEEIVDNIEGLPYNPTTGGDIY